MLIFKLLDRYEGIGQRGFFGCAVKLSNAFKSTRINLQILIIGIPLKINFLQFIRYGQRNEHFIVIHQGVRVK